MAQRRHQRQYQGEYISQRLYRDLGGRPISKGGFRSAEGRQRNPLKVMTEEVRRETESSWSGDKTTTYTSRLRGFGSARTKVGDASLLSETMKAYENPYLLFRTLGLEADLVYDVHKTTERTGLRDFAAKKVPFVGGPGFGETEYLSGHTQIGGKLNFEIDQETQAAVLDYERESRTAFMNSFFSRDF